MNTITVWVLVVTLYGHDRSPTVVVDNIHSQADCQFLGNQIKNLGSGYSKFSCFQVKKAKP